MISVPVVQLDHAHDLPLPSYATAGSAGMDVMAAIDAPITLAPFDRMAIPTGLTMAIPSGYEIQVRPRSGLALKQGLTVANAPGTIDSDYRGEIKVIVINLGQEAVEITRGMRIAQLVLAPVTMAKLEPVAALDETDRGDGGFGSTGLDGSDQTP
jgi:dUTP pyrophosphatase